MSLVEIMIFLLLRLKLDMPGWHTQPYKVVWFLPGSQLLCWPAPCTILLMLRFLFRSCLLICVSIAVLFHCQYGMCNYSIKLPLPFIPGKFFLCSNLCFLHHNSLLLRGIKLNFLMWMQGKENRVHRRMWLCSGWYRIYSRRLESNQVNNKENSRTQWDKLDK